MHTRQKLLRMGLLSLILLALLWLALGLTAKPLLINRSNGSYAVLAEDGKLLRLSLTSDYKYRLWTPLADIPATVQQATLHYEDRWFYQHPGINPFALVRAAWANMLSQDRWLGASTLSMQLARQRWRLKTDDLGGKVRQMAAAIWLERHFSKPELLEAYLNLAPYGANIEGIAAAAWVYFHKPVSALTLAEAKALVLIPQHPKQRAPTSPANIAALQHAWQVSYGNSAGFEQLWFRQRQDLPVIAPHFAERLHALYPDVALLNSTLHSRVQGLTAEILAGFLRQHRAQGIVNATAMVVHLPDMAVWAYQGSADYFNRDIQGYVNGLAAPRSPGSTLKPFIYAQAIAQGLITPDTLLKDTPLRMGDYQPENFERNFYGPLSATDALIRSRNIPAISLLAQLTTPTFPEFLAHAGIHIPKQASNYGLSLAIGSAEISMEDLLTLYGVLANQGELRPLRWLNHLAPVPGKPLIIPEAAYLVTEMLTANPRPDRSFGGHQFANTLPVAWKTGTSSGFKDAWAIAFSGDLLVGVWAGNFAGAPNQHLVGRELLGPLLFDLLDAISIEHRQPKQAAPVLPGLKKIAVCSLSGLPVSAWCPHQKTGWIIPGVSPLKTCHIHRQIRINPANGLRLCPDDPQPGDSRVAEFWDSDILAAFRQAGVRRDNPPPFAHACQTASEVNSHSPPQIIAPQSAVAYPISMGQQQTLEFHAIAAGGQRRLFWFVDDNFVGEGLSILWKAQPGKFVVTVVDEQGQADTVEIRVIAVE